MRLVFSRFRKFQSDSDDWFLCEYFQHFFQISLKISFNTVYWIGAGSDLINLSSPAGSGR